MIFLASIRSRTSESKAPSRLEGAGPGHDEDGDPGGYASGLNPQQAEAVRLSHEDAGPILVLAGAGSGKTTVLARRIARQALLDGGGGAILALTFTKEAAEEMEARVRGLLAAASRSGPPLSLPVFGTFHAFSLSLLRAESHGVPNWKRLGFARSPSLLESGAAAAWLAGIRREAPDAPAPSERLLAQPFAEEEAAEAGGAAGTAEHAMLNVRARWRDHLLSSGRLAFDDMVPLAIRLLRGHPHALSEVRRRIRRVLVDEFQDTSPDQLELVRLVLGGRPSLFLVGDDDQAIYAFRGADPGNIDKARELFPPLRILKLETNYRSTAPIVEYANAVFQGKPPHLRKRLRAGRAQPAGDRPSPVRTLIHAGVAEQGAWMAGEMKRLAAEEGLAWEGMAVLFRLNVLEPYYRSLVRTMVGPEAEGRMVFATVHASKGLQYPAVFLVGLEDGVLPYRRRGEKADPARLAEERRIFYVGVTRAERYLYLCACRGRMLRGRMGRLEPSPFLRTGRYPGAERSEGVDGRSGGARGWLGSLGRRLLGKKSDMARHGRGKDAG